MKVGQRIKIFRERASLTQAKLAEKASLDSNNLSRIERGEAVPSLDTVMKLCNALTITPNELLLFEYDAPKYMLTDEIAVLLDKCSEEELKKIIEYIYFIKKL